MKTGFKRMPPHVNVGTIGHRDFGHRRLMSAVPALLQVRVKPVQDSDATKNSEIDNSKLECEIVK